MSSSKSWCNSCQQEVFYLEDETTGSCYCVNCQEVIEQSSVVTNQITFSEDNRVVGQLVRGSGRAHGLRGHTESRENTIRKARERIRKIATKLKVGGVDERVNSALNLYKYCLEHGLTRGRRGDLLAAGCLYIVCRRAKTSHLLLDFSEALKEDIFVVSRTFFTLIKSLDIDDIPPVEPWSFVDRFCGELEFGEKTNAVAKTAMKLISQMKRDWIQTGRRPTSVCAAAILLAARAHGFQRTRDQIAKVMRIGEGTVTKRLKEIGKTNLASMTLREIDELPIQLSNDEKRSNNVVPPCFIPKPVVVKLETKEVIDVDEIEISEEALEELEEISGCESFRQVSLDLELGDKHEKVIRERVRQKNLQEMEIEKVYEDKEIQDEDVDCYVVTDEEEIKRKTRAWEILNEKYMTAFKKKQEEKEKKRKETEKRREQRKKRKRRNQNFVGNSASESVSRMLRRKVSQNILNKVGLMEDGTLLGDRVAPLEGPMVAPSEDSAGPLESSENFGVTLVDEVQPVVSPELLVEDYTQVSKMIFGTNQTDNNMIAPRGVQPRAERETEQEDDTLELLMEMAEEEDLEPPTKRQKIE